MMGGRHNDKRDRSQNAFIESIETYTSMTYFRMKTESTRLRITRMTRIIIANIIQEIRVIRSAYHKVQCSNLKVQR